MGEQVAARADGGIAQLGEHLPCKQGVKGSNPFISRSGMRIPRLHLENRIPKRSNLKIEFVNEIETRHPRRSKKAPFLQRYAGRGRG